MSFRVDGAEHRVWGTPNILDRAPIDQSVHKVIGQRLGYRVDTEACIAIERIVSICIELNNPVGKGINRNKSSVSYA